MHVVDARFGAYLAVATLLIVTPGPDTALVVRNALRAGWRAASLSTIGIALGSAVWAAASLLGLAHVLERSAVAFTVFKVAGGLYLAYLGSRSLIGGIRKARTGGAADGRPVQPVTDRAALRQGLVSNLLNPKAGAIFATVLPQFINRDDPVVRLLLMLVAYEAILLGWLTLYGYGVSRAGRSQAVGGVRRAMERVTGVVLISLGIRLALERR